MENPVTATSATDDSAVRERPVSHLVFFAKGIGPLALDVEVNEPGVLYTHIGQATDAVPEGAVVVMTDEVVDGRPCGTVYASVLHADRGETYTDDYYQGEIPALRFDRNDALWALDAIHSSGDLTNPRIVAQRNAKLERIRLRLENSGSEHKRRASEHAGRAQRVTDKRRRPNPMAAAMVNWGGTVRLDGALRVAITQQDRVSRSRVAIVRLLGSTWKAFHDAETELVSMLRWWAPGRKRPLSRSQAKRLSARAMNVYHQLGTVKAAPYGQMPMAKELQVQVFQFAFALYDPTRYRVADTYIRLVQRLAAKLLIHRDITKLLVTVGRVRRFKRRVAATEQIEYFFTANAILHKVSDLMQVGDRDLLLPRLRERLIRAESLGHGAFDAEGAYAELVAALELYLEAPRS